MRYPILLLAATMTIGCTSAERSAAPAHRSASVNTAPVKADRLSNLHHPVNTKSAEAQGHFDDGLTYCYAFNHDQAVRSFETEDRDPMLLVWHGGWQAAGLP